MVLCVRHHSVSKLGTMQLQKTSRLQLKPLNVFSYKPFEHCVRKKIKRRLPELLAKQSHQAVVDVMMDIVQSALQEHASAKNYACKCTSLEHNMHVLMSWWCVSTER